MRKNTLKNVVGFVAIFKSVNCGFNLFHIITITKVLKLQVANVVGYNMPLTDSGLSPSVPSVDGSMTEGLAGV